MPSKFALSIVLAGIGLGPASRVIVEKTTESVVCTLRGGDYLEWKSLVSNCIECNKFIFEGETRNKHFTDNIAAEVTEAGCECHTTDGHEILPPFDQKNNCNPERCWDIYTRMIRATTGGMNIWTRDAECPVCDKENDEDCESVDLGPGFGRDGLDMLLGMDPDRFDQVVNVIKSKGLHVPDEFRLVPPDDVQCSKTCADAQGPGFPQADYKCQKREFGEKEWSDAPAEECDAAGKKKPETCNEEKCPHRWVCLSGFDDSILDDSQCD